MTKQHHQTIKPITNLNVINIDYLISNLHYLYMHILQTSSAQRAGQALVLSKGKGGLSVVQIEDSDD